MGVHLDKKTLRNIFLGVGGCILLYWLLHDMDRVKNVYRFLKELFSPFVIGAALAFVLNVPMRAIEGKLGGIKKISLRRLLALLLTMIVILLVLFVMFRLLLPQIASTVESLVAKLPGFFNDILARVNEFLSENPEVMEWIEENTDYEKIDWASLVQKVVAFVGDSVSTIVGGAFSAIGSVSTGIFNGVIALVFSLYCLFRKEILARQARKLLYAFLPERFCDETIRILRLTNSTFSNFISGQCLEACILGCLFAFAMLVFRMPYIPLVSVLVAITALVPIVGAFVGCFLGAFFILVDNPMQAVWFVVMFLVIQQIEGNVIYPRVVGQSVGLPGMWVLLAVTVGGELMGVMGMLVMIPLVSVMYTLLREITDKRLSDRGIDPAKLQDQPPELSSGFRKRKKKPKETVAEQSSDETKPESQE